MTRAILEADGDLYLRCFSERVPNWGGPRRVTQAELRAVFADGWRIESIDPGRFETTIPGGFARAWLARIVRLG